MDLETILFWAKESKSSASEKIHRQGYLETADKIYLVGFDEDKNLFWFSEIDKSIEGPEYQKSTSLRLENKNASALAIGIIQRYGQSIQNGWKKIEFVDKNDKLNKFPEQPIKLKLIPVSLESEIDALIRKHQNRLNGKKKKSRPSRSSNSQTDYSKIIEILNTSMSREEGEKVLKPLKKCQLVELAKEMDLVLKGRTKSDICFWLVDQTIGDRLKAFVFLPKY